MTAIGKAQVAGVLLPELLTPEQVADYTGLSIRTLEKWRTEKFRDGTIPYVKIGGRVMYRAQDVADWIDAQVRR